MPVTDFPDSTPDEGGLSHPDRAAEDFGGGPPDEDAEQEQGRSRRRATLRTVVAVIILVIVAILVLMVVRSCTAVSSSTSGQTRRIVSVPQSLRDQNVVSVWIRPATSIRAILKSAGVDATRTTAMGEGLYFVFLPSDGQPAAAVARLKKDSRVYDAGYAYEQQLVKPSGSATTAP